MVRLQKLLVKNFKLLNFDDPLVFPDGVLAIQGPNEAGKSTILETILYALYGRTLKAPRGEKKTLIRYNTRTAFVKLWIEVQGDTYLITRKIRLDRPTEATLHLVQPDGQVKPVATGVTAVDAEILGLLDGIRFEDLVASNVVAQKDLNRITDLGRSKRIETINALLNRGCFDKAVETLKQQKKDLQQALNVEQKVLERLQSEAAAYHKKQQEQAQLITELNQLMERIQSLSQLVEKLGQHVKLLEQYRIADQQKKELERSKKAEKELLEKARAILKEIEKKEEELGKIYRRLDELAHVEEADNVLKGAERRLTELKEIEPEIRTLEENIAKVRQEIDNLEKFKDAEKETKKTETHIETLESQKLAYLKSPAYIGPILVTLGSSIGLLIFGYTLGGAAAFLLLIGLGIFFVRKVRSEWKRIDHSVKEEKEKLRIYQKQAAEYARKPDLEEVLVAQMLELTHKNARYSSLEVEAENVLATLPEVYRIFEEKELKIRVGKIREKIDANKNEKKQLHSQSAYLEEDIAKKDAIQTEIEKRNYTITNLDAQIRKIEFPPLPEGLIYSEETLNAKREQYRAKRTQLDTDIETHRMKQEQLDTVVAYLDAHAGVVERSQEQEQKVTGMRLDIRVAARTIDCVNKVAEDARKKVRPQAQIYMGRLLNKITNGKYKAAKLDEDYNLDVFSDEAGEFIDKTLFSGGTEDQFLLGLRLAFALSILPQEKETHLEFIFLDEPFAGSDKERRANILDLINEELLQNFKQIIIVSHQDDVLEASPHILRLENGRIR